MEALSSKGVVALWVTVPDPNMVRNQLAAAAASTAPSAPTESPVRPRGSTILHVVRVNFLLPYKLPGQAKVKAKAKGAPQSRLSTPALAGKSLEDKKATACPNPRP